MSDSERTESSIGKPQAGRWEGAGNWPVTVVPLEEVEAAQRLGVAGRIVAEKTVRDQKPEALERLFDLPTGSLKEGWAIVPLAELPDDATIAEYGGPGLAEVPGGVAPGKDRSEARFWSVAERQEAGPIRRVDAQKLGQAQDDESFEDLDDVVKELNEDDRVDKLLSDPRAPLASRNRPWEPGEARKYANDQAAAYRSAEGMSGAEVQAGHTAAARHAYESGISEADWDRQPMQQLHSRRGQGLDVSIRDDAGIEKTRTRHTAQEELIDDAVERVRSAQGSLTPQGQLDAAEEVRWRTENTPMDQRDVEDRAAGGDRGAAAADRHFRACPGHRAAGDRGAAAADRHF